MLEKHYLNLKAILRKTPDAIAYIKGSENYPQISGIVNLHQTNIGTVLSTEINGLPAPTGFCSSPIFAFHIHSGSSCNGNQADPFANAGMHYNPKNCPHPHHSGDLPPLFGCDGYAMSLFLTNRFSVEEVIGKTIVIHSAPDDFKTQPSGNSGIKIACGEIRTNKKNQ